MTDGPGGSLHLLRPSIPESVPPLPRRGGARLRISLGYATEDSAGRRTRIFTYPENVTGEDTTQHEDLHEGDTFGCRSWQFEVVEIDLAEGVRLRLLPEDPDA